MTLMFLSDLTNCTLFLSVLEGSPFSNKNLKISDSDRLRGKLVIFIPSYFFKSVLSQLELLLEEPSCSLVYAKSELTLELGCDNSSSCNVASFTVS